MSERVDAVRGREDDDLGYFDSCLCGALWKDFSHGVEKMGEGKIRCKSCGRYWGVAKGYTRNKRANG